MVPTLAAADPVSPDGNVIEDEKGDGAEGEEGGRRHGEELECSEEEEVRDFKVARRPRGPTKKELEEHLPLHMEYRDWCEDCVAGRGVAAPHKRTAEGDEPDGVTIYAC